MKSTKNTPQEIPKNIEFPVMMAYQDDSFVVLFFSEKTGTIVWSEEKIYKLGSCHEDWDNVSDPCWKPFNGSIALEN